MAVDLSKNEDLQRLFLLELLVDCVKFDHKKIDLEKSILNLLKQTCVRFNFLNFPVIEVCEEDFCPTQGDYKASDIAFKNGKSCFFSLSGLPLNTECLKIGATIMRQKDESPPVLIGTTCIQLDKNFVNVLNNHQNISDSGESCKSLKDVFPIFDDKGIMIGSITLFVRLSCFGKAIITHFKIPQESEAAYMFSNTNESQKPQIGTTGAGNLTPPKTAPLTPGSSNNHSRRSSIQNNKGGLTSKCSENGANITPTTTTPVTASGDTRIVAPGTQGTSAGHSLPSGGTPGMYPGDAAGIYSGGASGMYPGGAPGMYPGGAPGMYPGGAPGMYPGGAPGMYPGSQPGMYPSAQPGMYPNAQPGMYPGGAPGTFPGGATGMIYGSSQGIYPVGTLGTAPGGESGISQMYGIQGIMQESPYGSMTPLASLNTTNLSPESGKNKQRGKVSHSSALKSSVDNRISKNYKELSVTINGHAFTINVLRKTRKKREKTPEFQLCGRLPTPESSESDESTEDESEEVKQFQPILREEVEKEKEKEIAPIPVREVNQTVETKPLIINNQTKPESVQPKISPQPTKPQNIPLGLCECDIPLPRGFQIPDTFLKKVPSQTIEPPAAAPPKPGGVITTVTEAPQTQRVINTPLQTTTTPSTVVYRNLTPPSSFISVSQPIKKIKEKKRKKPKESPKTHCLQPNCPMGFSWPPGVPQEKKIVKVPCCPQIPMHPGSVGIKGEQVVLQMANELMSDLDLIQDERELNHYGLKLGATNLAKSKCTKMILELPVPKLKVTEVETGDHDTQYLESDIPVPEKVAGKGDEKKKGKGKGKGKKGKKGKGGKKGKKK